MQILDNGVQLYMVLANLEVMVYNLDVVLGNLVNLDDL
jgi:hypothetical protein